MAEEESIEDKEKRLRWRDITDAAFEVTRQIADNMGEINNYFQKVADGMQTTSGIFTAVNEKISNLEFEKTQLATLLAHAITQVTKDTDKDYIIITADESKSLSQFLFKFYYEEPEEGGGLKVHLALTPKEVQ